MEGKTRSKQHISKPDRVCRFTSNRYIEMPKFDIFDNTPKTPTRYVCKVGCVCCSSGMPPRMEERYIYILFF